MCDEEEESMSHLFLQHPFARAVWYGSPFGIRTTELDHVSAKQWIQSHITATNIPGQMKSSLLQSIFTILWTIWTHKNLVLHKGKSPSPVEVVLTLKSLICKYKEAFNQSQRQKHIQRPKSRTMDFSQNQQLLIKVAATKNKRTKRSDFAVDARNLDGAILFKGGASSGKKKQHQVAQEALLEALIKAKELGNQRLFIVSNDRYLVNLCNHTRKTV